MRHLATGRWLAWGGYMAVALGALLAACSTPPSVAHSRAGTVHVRLAGLPSCAHEHVFVTIERLLFLPEGVDSRWVDVALATPRRIDLAALSSPTDLVRATVPEGRYDTVQFVLRRNGGVQQLANAMQPRGGALVAMQTPERASVPVALDVRADATVPLDLAPDVCSAVQAGLQGVPVLQALIPADTQRIRTAALATVLP